MKAFSVVFAAIGLPIALVLLIAPVTWGYGGLTVRFKAGTTANDTRATIRNIDAGGVAARAGLRVGTQFFIPYQDRVTWNSGRAGDAITILVLRGNRWQPMKLTWGPFTPPLATVEEWRKTGYAITALLAFVLALLVGMRARESRLGPIATFVLLALGWRAVAGALTLAAPTTALSEGAQYAVWLTDGVILAAMLFLLGTFPPNPGIVRRVLQYAAVPAGILAWLASTIPYVTFYVPLTAAQHFRSSVGNNGIALAGLLQLLLVAACVDALVRAPITYRAATRWLAGSWLIAAALTAGYGLAYDLIAGTFGIHALDPLPFIANILFAFGISYPILRHRLTDLNIFVTRATIYAVVLLVIVALFALAEWLVGRLFENAPQVVALIIVLILGISVRWIHAIVESRLTAVVFHKRIAGLNDIRRVAREADIATDSHAIMQVACATMHRGLDIPSVAFYLRDGNEYVMLRAAGDAPWPEAFDMNSALLLRLRRWKEPFETLDAGGEHHTLVLPMNARGVLVGFACCGPKADRTAYLTDEIDALAYLATEVGVACAWLSQMQVPEPAITRSMVPTERLT
ncbi:MAG TPA: hypothetical protein VFO29_01900 [Candidatus Rubrimentiphilum sp.]|nr:hypothetical protein [Candidatus Rubrimentiphilum sp.]